MVKQGKSYRNNDLLQLILGVAILIAISVASGYAYLKIDLTEENRHTLTDSTTEMLESLEDEVFVRCYLHGDFPARFKRLEKAIQERLDEFNDYSGGKVRYEFIDIYESGDKQTIGENEQALFEQGLLFTRISYKENGVTNDQTIWPGAIMTYKGEQVPVQLFKSQMPEPSDEMVNTSINNIEFEFASNLRALLRDETPNVGVLQGHGELLPIEMADVVETLKEQERYNVSYVEIDGQINALSELPGQSKNRVNRYDLLIIAKPDSVFDRKDKILLDQYIMNGGAVLWCVDPILTDLDSLRETQQTLATTNEMGLYDMLFDYGVRLNRNLIIDYQCAPILLDGGPLGNQRNMQFSNWYFAPVAISDGSHPIAANLDPIHFDFASSLEIVGNNPDVEKTVLLSSSKLSLERKAPIRVNPGIVKFDLDYFRDAAHQSYPLAVLLEGRFTSNFKGRLNDTLVKSESFAYRDKSLRTRMAVIADGDIIRNKYIPVEGGLAPLPLGYDRYAQAVVYDNKEFILNTINYLLDDPELISIRSRSIELRKLDQEVLKDKRNLLQILNVAAPLFLVALAGLILVWMRKRQYAKNE